MFLREAVKPVYGASLSSNWAAMRKYEEHAFIYDGYFISIIVSLQNMAGDTYRYETTLDYHPKYPYLSRCQCDPKLFENYNFGLDFINFCDKYDSHSTSKYRYVRLFQHITNTGKDGVYLFENIFNSKEELETVEKLNFI